MAHLARCHCRRVFRCDQEHPHRGCFDGGDYHCPCPDAGLPGHDLPPLTLTTITFPVLKQPFPTLLAADIVSIQPMTSPRIMESAPNKPNE